MAIPLLQFYDQYHHYVVENRLSSRNASFTFNNEPITLQLGESVARSINSWDGRFVPENIIFVGYGEARMIAKSRAFIFVDVASLNLYAGNDCNNLLLLRLMRYVRLLDNMVIVNDFLNYMTRHKAESHRRRQQQTRLRKWLAMPAKLFAARG